MFFLPSRNPKSQITSGLRGTVLLRALPNVTLHRNGAVSLPRPTVLPRTKSPNGPGNLQFLRLSLLKPGGIRGKCNPYVPESFTLKS